MGESDVYVLAFVGSSSELKSYGSFGSVVIAEAWIKENPRKLPDRLFIMRAERVVIVRTDTPVFLSYSDDLLQEEE